MDRAGKTNRSHWIAAGTTVLTVAPEEVLKVVSDVTGVSVEDMKGKVRKRHIADARHLFQYICKIHAVQSLEVIGRIINKDHSSVVHGHKKITDLIETDVEIRHIVKRIQKVLKITTKTIEDVK